MFIAVDDNGDLHKTAFTEFNKRYDEHPDTKLKYENYNIPNVKGIIDAAYRIHNLIPQLGCRRCIVAQLSRQKSKIFIMNGYG